MKAHREGGAEIELHSFLTSALDGSGQLHAPAAFYMRKNITGTCLVLPLPGFASPMVKTS